MKILIDGCIFVEQCEGDAFSFWIAAIPGLPSLLEEHSIYFLNREFTRRFSESANLRNLYAPRPDWERSPLEDRRLATLCRELEIDVFVSTYHTSAGTNVKSLYVFTKNDHASLPLNEHANELVILSAKRAARMACRCWTIPSNGLNDLPILIDQLARAILEAAEYRLSEDDNARRSKEERTVIAYASNLQRAALNETIEMNRVHRQQQAAPLESVSSKTRYLVLGRLYHAVTSPHKWPDYASRLYRRIRRVTS